MAGPPQRNTPSNPVVEAASSRLQVHLLLPNLVIELQVRPCSCHVTTEEHTFHLYSRTCKLQSTKATSTAKSNNRTPGETLQRNTPSASLVEVTSSRVHEHLPLPNLIMECWVNHHPSINLCQCRLIHLLPL